MIFLCAWSHLILRSTPGGGGIAVPHFTGKGTEAVVVNNWKGEEPEFKMRMMLQGPHSYLPHSFLSSLIMF